MLKRTIILSVVLLLGLAVLNQAQMRMSPEERAKQLTEQLKLTKDQTKKVEEIFKKSQDKMQKIFDSGSGFGDPDTRDKIMKLRDESNNEVMKLLNDKQKTEYKKILEEQRKRMEERRQNRGN